jgi:hypothetical protein
MVNIHNFNDLVETLLRVESTFKETLTRRDRKEHGRICKKCASQLMSFSRNTIGTRLVNDESGDQIIFSWYVMFILLKFSLEYDDLEKGTLSISNYTF